MNHKILLVEDDPTLNESITKILKEEKYLVTSCHDVKSALLQLKNSFDLYILDWMLPDGQGIDIVKEIRKNNHTLPLIMLTARNDLIDKVIGLESGANDYITKPFETRELLARIRVQLRYKNIHLEQPVNSTSLGDTGESLKQQPITHGSLSFDVYNREFFYQNKPITLTKMEFEFLKLLIENPKKTFAREHLLDLVWGYDNYPTTRTIDTHVLQLRQKISEDVIDTVRGLGYRLGPCLKTHTN